MTKHGRVGLPSAEEVRELLVQDKFVKAQQLNAVWHADGATFFSLLEAKGRIRVRLAKDGAIHVRFISGEPVCELELLSDGNIRHYCRGVSCPRPGTQMNRIFQSMIGPAERAIYGWVPEGKVATLLVVCEDFLEGEAQVQPFGIAGFTLKEASFPEGLRLPQVVNNRSILEWLREFWRAVATNQLIRLDSRIKSFPGDVVLRTGWQESFVSFRGNDGEWPLISAQPYLCVGGSMDAYRRLLGPGKRGGDLRGWVR